MTNPGPVASRPCAVRALEVDDVRLTYLVDGTLTMDPREFLPGTPAAHWAAHPDELDARGMLVMSAGGLLVERDGHRLLIDAGNGQDVRDIPIGRIDCGALPEVLAGTGVRPSDIELVAFTHFHLDHTGWAFEPRDGGFAPLFPEAEYLVSTAEALPYRRGERPPVSPAPEFVDALLARCRELDDGAEIAPGVTAVVTPGHSAGHTSYVITTRTGRRVVAFGDVFHTPAQLARPEWCSSPDVDPAGVPAARARITAELARPDTIGFGCHFGDQPFGTVRRDEAGVARWSAAPSTVVAPPPR